MFLGSEGNNIQLGVEKKTEERESQRAAREGSGPGSGFSQNLN